VKAPQDATYRLGEDLVAVQNAGRIQLTRAQQGASARVLHSRDPMVAQLLGHFQTPSNEDAWISSHANTRQTAARAAFRRLVDSGFLAPVDTTAPQADPRSGPNEAEDLLLEAIVMIAQQLRADLRTAPDALDHPEGPSRPAALSVLHACRGMLETLTGHLVRHNNDRVRAFLQTRTAPRRLHLGCGETRLAGWLNIDLNGGDLSLDLRRGLPFEAGSVSAIYMGHLLEHFDYKHAALGLLHEAHRVLAHGGVLRVAVPDIESFIRAYAAGEPEFFARFEQLWQRPRADSPLATFLHYAGAGGFEHVIDRHRFGYDALTLGALLREAGFSHVRRALPGDSAIDDPSLDYSWASRASAAGRPFCLIMEAIA
jgi:predicted SAM-dependent methyltransferase